MGSSSGSHSEQGLLLHQSQPENQACIADDGVPVAFRRYPGIVKHSILSTTPTTEKPALTNEQRAERLRLLAERLRRRDGLDRDTLEHIEQLTGAKR
jgi:acetyl esterase/lipase